MPKERLDVLVVERGLCETREKAKRLIMAGEVYVDGKPMIKSGTKIDDSCDIEVKGEIPFVSRGGFKLQKALQVFNTSVQGKVAIDVGASTGGFTDCLLQNGAQKVFSVDVGYGQLDWRLRNDSRVVVMERTNIRYVTPGDLGEQADLATIDVAFISIRKFLRNLLLLLKDDGEIISLIKPQFEAGPENVGKKGVVRDEAVHRQVLQDVLTEASNLELGLLGLTFSPIKGAEGNIEYLAHWQKGVRQEVPMTEIDRVVSESHASS